MQSLHQPKRLRILALTSSYPNGDHDLAGRFVAEWAESITPLADVTVVAPPVSLSSPQTPSLEPRTLKPEPNAVQVHRFSHTPQGWPPKLTTDTDLRRMLGTQFSSWFELLPFHTAFFQKARQLAANADVICSHWLLPSALVGVSVARLTGLPHIAIEHSGGLRLLNRLPGGSHLLRFLLKHSAGCAAVSQELKAQIVAACPSFAEKIRVLPMGIDLEKASQVQVLSKEVLRKNLDLPSGKLLLLFLGRHVEIKGLPVVLNAIQNRNDVFLVVAGDGPCRSAWENLAQDLCAPVRFIGAIHGSEKWSWLAAADVVVIPSLQLPDGRTEGSPVVCLEALAAGTPVMASKVGGLPEQICEGVNGWLLPAGQVSVWKEAIGKLAEHQDVLQHISASAQLHIHQHDWKTRGREYAEWILTLCQ